MKTPEDETFKNKLAEQAGKLIYARAGAHLWPSRHDLAHNLRNEKVWTFSRMGGVGEVGLRK